MFLAATMWSPAKATFWIAYVTAAAPEAVANAATEAIQYVTENYLEGGAN